MKGLLSLLIGLSLGCVSCTRDVTPKPVADQTTDTAESFSLRADIPIYPDARMPDNKSNVRSNGGQTRLELVMRTSDPIEKVAKFYVKELKLDRSKEGNAVRLMGRTPKGNYAIVDLTKVDNDTLISAVAIAIDK